MKVSRWSRSAKDEKSLAPTTVCDLCAVATAVPTFIVRTVSHPESQNKANCDSGLENKDESGGALDFCKSSLLPAFICRPDDAVWT